MAVQKLTFLLPEWGGGGMERGLKPRCDRSFMVLLIRSRVGGRGDNEVPGQPAKVVLTCTQ